MNVQQLRNSRNFKKKVSDEGIYFLWKIMNYVEQGKTIMFAYGETEDDDVFFDPTTPIYYNSNTGEFAIKGKILKKYNQKNQNEPIVTQGIYDTKIKKEQEFIFSKNLMEYDDRNIFIVDNCGNINLTDTNVIYKVMNSYVDSISRNQAEEQAEQEKPKKLRRVRKVTELEDL